MTEWPRVEQSVALPAANLWTIARQSSRTLAVGGFLGWGAVAVGEAGMGWVG